MKKIKKRQIQKKESQRQKEVHLLKGKRGSTMTEVLVAFIIVTIAFASFARILTFSENMLNKYQQAQKEYENFNAQYYKYKSIFESTSPPDISETSGTINPVNAIELNLVMYKDTESNKNQNCYYENVKLNLGESKLYYYTDNVNLHRLYFLSN